MLNTGDPTLAGFRLGDAGLEPIHGSRAAPGRLRTPAQAGFAPDGSALVVTHRGTDSLAIFPVDADGLLGDPRELPSSGPTPYGFAFAGGTLVVTEAFGAQVGTAARRLTGIPRLAHAVSRSVGQRPQRDLLGRHDAGLSLGVHDQLRGRRRIALRDRRRRRLTLEDATRDRRSRARPGSATRT